MVVKYKRERNIFCVEIDLDDEFLDTIGLMGENKSILKAEQTRLGAGRFAQCQRTMHHDNVMYVIVVKRLL